MSKHTHATSNDMGKCETVYQHLYDAYGGEQDV
jgi:hypothetical protein